MPVSEEDKRSILRLVETHLDLASQALTDDEDEEWDDPDLQELLSAVQSVLSDLQNDVYGRRVA